MDESKAIDTVKNYYFNNQTVNPIELAQACAKLCDEYKTGKQVASKFGTSASFINFWRRINELPDDIKGYISRGDLKPSAAEVLHRIKNLKDKRELAWAVIDNELTKSETVKLVNYIRKNNKPVREGIAEIYGTTDTKLHAIVVGLNDDLYRKLRVLAGKSGTFEKEMCERIIKYWIKIGIELGKTDLENLFDKIRLYHSIIKKASNL